MEQAAQNTVSATPKTSTGGNPGGGGNRPRAAGGGDGAVKSMGDFWKTTAPQNMAANSTAASAQPRQTQQQNPNRSDVDGSRWANQKTDDEILALMTETEDTDGSGSFASMLGMNEDEGDSIDGLIDDEGFEPNADNEGFEQTGEDAGADPDADAPTDDADDFESELNVDQAKLAAKFLLENGADRNEIKALLKNAPNLLLDIARQRMAQGQQQTAQQPQNGKPGADPFDTALDEVLAPALKGLSSQFDTEGDDTVTRAITEPVRMGIRFLGDKVAQRFQQTDQIIQQLGTALEDMQISLARQALASDFPTISNDKMFQRVRDRMGKMKGGGHKNMQELMADAAQRELGSLTRAQQRVQETRERRQRSISTSAEGVGTSSNGKKPISRDQMAELNFTLMEKGMSAPERAKYITSRYVISKPKPKGGG